MPSSVFVCKPPATRRSVFTTSCKLCGWKIRTAVLSRCHREKVLLHASRDLEITAPGRAILIKSKTIDFEQMEDIEEIEDADSD